MLWVFPRAPTAQRGVVITHNDTITTTQTQTPGVYGDAWVCNYLGSIKPRTLRLWRRKRGLPHIKITPKVIRYRKADIDAWLESNRQACR